MPFNSFKELARATNLIHNFLMNLIYFDYNFYNFIQIRRIDQKSFQKLRKDTIVMEFTNTLFTFSILQNKFNFQAF